MILLTLFAEKFFLEKYWSNSVQLATDGTYIGAFVCSAPSLRKPLTFDAKVNN